MRYVVWGLALGAVGLVSTVLYDLEHLGKLPYRSGELLSYAVWAAFLTATSLFMAIEKLNERLGRRGDDR